jgi:hypothetical protein
VLVVVALDARGAILLELARELLEVRLDACLGDGRRDHEQLGVVVADLSGVGRPPVAQRSR